MRLAVESPIELPPEQKALVIEKACSKPEGGYTNWSQKRIADEVGISQSKVFQILNKADLKPHKTEYWCGTPRDPEFVEKMLNPGNKYLMLIILGTVSLFQIRNSAFLNNRVFQS
jgi:hypothetical protein